MIEHSKPTIGLKEKQAVIGVLNSNFLAEGQQVKSFEKEIARYIGSSGGVATSTGTLGLHLALLCLEPRKKDEIIIPSYSCRSILNAVINSGLKPVLCDIDAVSYNLSFEDAAKKVSKRTKAVILPHMFGQPAPVDKFKNLGIAIIEDCAHAIGSIYKGRKVGSWGKLSIFSFEGTKYIVTGEGGMVLANSNRMLKKLRSLKERDSLEHLAKYTYRMTDIQASIGRVQLEELEGFITKRISIADTYTKFFKNLVIRVPEYTEYGRHIYQRYMMQIGGDINKFMLKCFKKGIKVKRPVKPFALHRYMGLSARNFPNTEYVMKSAISIPIYPSLTKKQIYYIIDTITKILKHNDK